MAESDPDHDGGSSWGVEPQESGFVAFWPHAEAPSQGEVTTALSAWFASEISPDQIESDDDAIWTMGIEVPGIDSGLVVWVERSRALSRNESEQLGPEAAACPWVIRLQTILSTEEPAADYFMVVSLLGGALPDVIAVLDVVTGAVIPRRALERDFLTAGAEPVEGALWRLTRYDTPEPREQRSVLLSTGGLARCGLPELELLEVPWEQSEPAAVLLNTVAALMLENGSPEPGEEVEVGDGLSVSLQKVEQVQEFLKDETAGSAKWRKQVTAMGHPEFSVARAAICGTEPEGTFRKIWTWPRGVIERIASGHAVLYLTKRTVRASERRARGTWPTFAMAHASLTRSSDPKIRKLADEGFVVQAAVPGSGTPRVEQSWFQVRRIDHDKVSVVVIDQPITRPDLAVGAPLELAANAITDWRVELAETIYDPDEADQLLAAVDRIREVGLPNGEETT